MLSRNEEHAVEMLCARVAEAVGDGVTTSKMEVFRRYLHEMERDVPRYSRTTAHWVLAVSAAMSLVLGIVYLLHFRASNLQFWVGSGSHAGIPGEDLVADGERETPIVFEGGSVFHLKKGAVAMIEESTENCVRVSLKNGELSAKVKGNGKTQWSIAAGETTVVVVGTKFKVTFDAERHISSVSVDQGIVRVFGTTLADNGLTLSAGNHLTVDQITKRCTVNAVTSQSPAVATRIDGDVSIENKNNIGLIEGDINGHHSESNDSKHITRHKVEDGDTVAGGGRISRRGQTGQQKRSKKHEPMSLDLKVASPKMLTGDETAQDSGNTPSEDTWRTAYRTDRLAYALLEAEHVGINPMVSTLDLDGLWKLAEAARNEARYGIAKKALLACRTRFRSTEKARLAAFILGKIEDDKLGDVEEAIRWFSTYLRENRNGDLAEEARMRIVQGYRRLNRKQDAFVAARAYLRRYPNGRFSRTVQLMVETGE